MAEPAGLDAQSPLTTRWLLTLKCGHVRYGLGPPPIDSCHCFECKRRQSVEKQERLP